MTDRDLLFTSKFWFLLYYFLGIKKKLSTTFHPQTTSQTKRQNSTIKAYLRAFINQEQDDWARLLPMTEFAYNNAKNISTSHTPFELNCGYHPRVFFEEDVDPHSRSRFANKLTKELRELMKVCCQNLLHIQELQQRAYEKGITSRSYAPDKKVWLNSKYIKIKKNKKLKSKFFGPFQVLHTVGKQAYKLELSTNWKIYDVFHVSLLEQDITRKRQVDKALSKSEKDVEFEVGDNKEYKVETIINRAVYGQQANSNQMLGLYYLVSWKGYLEEKNIWEPLLTVIYLRKLISTFHKEYPKKLTATSPSLNSALLIARPTIPKEQQPKQKRDRPSKKANKRGRKQGVAPSNNAFCSPKRAAMPFVAPDMDVVLKPLIQSL